MNREITAVESVTEVEMPDSMVVAVAGRGHGDGTAKRKSVYTIEYL
jgi:hypothetical protein